MRSSRRVRSRIRVSRGCLLVRLYTRPSGLPQLREQLREAMKEKELTKAEKILEKMRREKKRQFRLLCAVQRKYSGPYEAALIFVL